MSMDQNANREAIMLLTAGLGSLDKREVKPLTTREYGRLARWLIDREMQPSELMQGIPSGWQDKKITHSRLETLLDRGLALGMAIDEWERAGLWVLTRADKEYPRRLKKKKLLRDQGPPILYGCGNRRLLNQGLPSIAVVGSRNASEEDLEFTQDLGKRVADQGYTVVSGGARGVDQSAMFGALEHEGTVIGVLANNLLRAAVSSDYRGHIESDNLVLVSHTPPEARFRVWNAMARNDYIYCLAGAAVAICSTPNKGGTWAGAVKNLDKGWVPLWLKRNTDPKSGNSHLQRKGGHWLPEGAFRVDTLLNPVKEPSHGDEPAKPVRPAPQGGHALESSEGNVAVKSGLGSGIDAGRQGDAGSSSTASLSGG